MWPGPARHGSFVQLLLLVVACVRTASPANSVDEPLLRVQQFIARGDLGEARRELERLVQIAATDPRVFNLLGVIDARENRFSPAELNFKRAIALAPRFLGAYMNLGRLYQSRPSDQEASKKALEVYLRSLEFAPADVEANYQAAALLLRSGKFTPSLEHLSRLPPDARQRAAVLALRYADYVGLGVTARALTVEKQLAAAPDLAELDVLPILPLLHAHGADDTAARLLESLAVRGAATPAGLQALAGIQEKQGRLKHARESLERDLRLEPPTAAVLVQLARLAYRTGDLEGSLGYLAHARDLEPGNASIHYCFGLICVDLKLPPEARQSLAKAVELDGGNPYFSYALGAVLLQQKEADLAIPHFQKYCSALPDDAHGRLALGVAYFDAYQFGAARKELELAAANPETRAGGSLYLGRLALTENRPAEAANRFREAIQANPSQPDAYAELAVVHIHRGDFALAGTDLAAALKIAPDHYRSNLNLLLLYQRSKDPRSAEQARRVEQLQRAGEERERMLLRSLDLRPY